MSAPIEALIGARLVNEQTYVDAGVTAMFAGMRGTTCVTPVDDDEGTLVFRFVKSFVSA